MVEPRSSVEAGAEEPRAAYGMKCPRCESQLVPGRLKCRRSFFSLNVAPELDARIWSFQGYDGIRAETLTSRRQADAYRCPHCELLVIPRMRASWATGSIANTLQVGVPRSTARALGRRLQISLGESAELVEAIVARKRWLKWIPGPIALLVFLGWMLSFSVTTNALDLINVDGLVGVVAVILMGYGVAIVLALVAGRAVGRRLLLGQLDHHLADPICFWCGYALQGLEPTDGAVRCPECGRRSPVDHVTGGADDRLPLRRRRGPVTSSERAEP